MSYSLAGTLSLLLALGAALAYLPMTGGAPTWRRSVTKTIPGLAMTGFCLLAGLPPLITAGIAASTLGDAALSRPGDRAFLIGLVAFALAHLLYILAFAAQGSGPAAGFSTLPVAAVALIAFALSTERWLQPHSGTMAWPVRAYVALITAMVVAALGLGNATVLAGAALFMLSDLLLGLLTFRLKGNGVRAHHWAIWITYCLGQALIVAGQFA